jgi:serine/threonine protein kinase
VQGIDKDIKFEAKNFPGYDIVGCLHYIAPEMILLKGYSNKVNLWRLGVCAYYLLYGNYPFEGTTSKKVYHEILSKKLKP